MSKSDPIVDEFRKCKRKVPVSRVEDKDSKKFWNDLFAKLDSDVLIPPHKRMAVLKNTFKDQTLKKILEILTVDFIEDDVEETPEEIDADIAKAVRSESAELDGSLTQSYRDCAIAPMKRIDFRIKLINQIDSLRQDNNMYMNFLNLSPDLAQKWRPKPPLTFMGMNLSEKCEAITLSIATSFVDWLKGLGGDEATTLNVPVILNLFEVGFNAHAADSLCVKIRELNAVTKSIANARHLPEMSYTAHLYKQLYRDINSVRPRDEMFAFGTMLPPDMRPPPQRENIAAKWITNKRVPEKIATMAIIWEGIESFRSTHGFCKWLEQHPEIEPPQYLSDQGLLYNDADQDDMCSSVFSTR